MIVISYQAAPRAIAARPHTLSILELPQKRQPWFWWLQSAPREKASDNCKGGQQLLTGR
jgi:hypothetical protein